jgi:hypothetical protein
MVIINWCICCIIREFSLAPCDSYVGCQAWKICCNRELEVHIIEELVQVMVLISLSHADILTTIVTGCWYQWPRGPRRRSAAARLLRSWVQIPPGAWICCVSSGRGLCDELITRAEESYRLWCIVVCDLETSRMRRPWPALNRSATKKNVYKMSWRSSEVL